MADTNRSINTTLTEGQLTALKVRAIQKGHKGIRSYVTALILADLELEHSTVSSGIDIRPPEAHPGDEWHCGDCFRWVPADERRGKFCASCE